MASKTTQSSAIDYILECKLCENQIKQPCTLGQCLHSYCKTCLDALPKEKKDDESGWFCPLCKTFSKNEVVEEDAFLIDLLELSTSDGDHSESKSLNCQQCLTGVKSSKKCAECKIELCDNCQQIHLRIPMLKDHKMINLDEKRKGVIDKLIYCSIHPSKVIEYHCQVCESPICSICNLNEHNTHTTETVTQTLERLVPQMQSNAETINTNIKAITEQIETIRKIVEETKEYYSTIRLAMDERFDILINKLKAIKTTMEDDVTEKETQSLDTLKNIKETLENQLSISENISHLIDVTVGSSTHTSLLTHMQNGLRKKANEFCGNEQETVCINIEMPKLNEALKYEINDLQKYIGELKYHSSSCYIDNLDTSLGQSLSEKLKSVVMVGCANSKTKPGSNKNDEGTEENQSEDDREVLFSKRATMFYIDDDMVAKNQGIGELEICVDDDILAYRVRMESDEANFLCYHIICRRHVIQKSEKKKFAEWTAKDFSTDEPIKRTFKVQFSSASATKEFYDIFNQGIQSAKESEVDEVADGANVTGELIFPQASAQGNN